MKKQVESKKMKLSLLAIVLIVTVNNLAGQVKISGPACVIPGLTYQYVLQGNWNEGSSMQLCVTGGALATGQTCTPSGTLLSSVFVIWSDTGSHKLLMTSSSGNDSLIAETTVELNGGTINENDKVKVYDSTSSAGYLFRCEAASGGTCNPVYTYLWQRSDNALNWLDIEGANSKDFNFTGTVKVNTYFRRVTVETASGAVAYSDKGLLVVVFNQ